MKDIKKWIIVFCCLLPLPAFADQALQWQYNGTVRLGQTTIKTGLQNAYSAMAVSHGIFLAGYKIDPQGINFPYVVYVDKHLKNIKSWPQATDVKQFFVYQNQVNLLDADGGVQVYRNDAWHKVDDSIIPGSIVVYSQDFIIACKPAPIMAVSAERGICYSPQKQWNVELSWRQVEPKICNDVLTVIEDQRKKVMAHQINMESGELLNSKPLTTPVKDPCQAF